MDTAGSRPPSIDAATFARLADMPPARAARVLAAALAGTPWAGQDLAVVDTPAGPQVRVDSLPAPLRQTLYLEQAKAAGLDARALGLTTEQVLRVHARHQLIAPAAATRRHTPERREALRAAIEQTKAASWRDEAVTESTLYAWLRAYERRGLLGLAPVPRKDKGTRHTLVIRHWDTAAAAHLGEEAMERVAEDLKRYLRSCWASGVHGWRQIVELGEVKLRALCQAAGWAADAATCRLSRATVEPYRGYHLLHIEDADAKRYFDAWLPRIRRTRESLEPMDLVVGDVHPIDVLLSRPDGSAVYARAIAWHDVATNRVWLTLIMLGRGEGVRREHIAQSFASLCAHWGLPKRLYLDNGSEYNWAEMIAGFSELARLVTGLEVRLLDQAQDLRTIIRARPYNAPAKAIEGLFGVLETNYLRQISGWVGGDRTAKKTQNVGRAPLAFHGAFDAFHQAVDTTLERYHKRDQPTLDDRSPNAALADWIARGWTATKVHEAALLLAFSVEDTRVPDRGVITLDGIAYYHDALLPIGKRLRVRLPKHDPRMIFCFDGAQLLCAATPDPRFGALERAGAAEQGRRSGALRRQISAMRKHCDRLDLLDEMAQWNATKPEAPATPFGAEVVLSEDVRQMLAAARAAEDAALDAARADSAAPGQRRLSQWSQADETDPYRRAVGWDD